MGLGGTKLQATSYKSLRIQLKSTKARGSVGSGGIKPQGMANYGLFQLSIILWLAQSRHSVGRGVAIAGIVSVWEELLRQLGQCFRASTSSINKRQLKETKRLETTRLRPLVDSRSLLRSLN